jgi:geranylgeranyl pyrophosphate synthase
VTERTGGTGTAAGGTRSSRAPAVRAPRKRKPGSRTAFAAQLGSWQSRVEQALDERLPAADTEPSRLHAAMRYCVLNGGGPRVRPLLLFGTCRAVGLSEAQVETAACAVELAHAYSLVHDDLPAMDDADLRRGLPSCHKAYDQGTAVLVGDALQSLAFQLLATDDALPAAPAIRLRLTVLLAEAIGASGMAGGQALDVATRGQRRPGADIEAMYARRTGALIRASVLMAAACAPEAAAHLQEALAAFATPLGLAFQIQDDLLNVSIEAGGAGQATRPDRASRGDAAYPAVLGLAAAQQRVRALYTQAHGALRPFGPAADPLRALTEWLLVRSS